MIKCSIFGGLMSILAVSLAIQSFAEKEKSSTISFPHAKVLDFYAEAAKKSMLDQPRDGRFGATRVPSVHLLYANNVKGYKEVKELGKDYILYSFLSGTKTRPIRPESLAKGKKNASMILGSKAKMISSGMGEPIALSPLLRLYDKNDWSDGYMAGLFFDQPRGRGGYQPTNAVKKDLKDIGTDIVKKVVTTTLLSRKNRFDDYSSKTKVANHEGWVMSKAIIPKTNSCYNCHVGSKPGEPVGHIVTFLLKRQKS